MQQHPVSMSVAIFQQFNAQMVTFWKRAPRTQHCKRHQKCCSTRQTSRTQCGFVVRNLIAPVCFQIIRNTEIFVITIISFLDYWICLIYFYIWLILLKSVFFMSALHVFYEIQRANLSFPNSIALLRITLLYLPLQLLLI